MEVSNELHAILYPSWGDKKEQMLTFSLAWSSEEIQDRKETVSLMMVLLSPWMQ
jgi:hypothetical protein